jgi:hypothetical protein
MAQQKTEVKQQDQSSKMYNSMVFENLRLSQELELSRQGCDEQEEN